MILDRFKLDGKVAVVTGASRGLGQGMAVALAEAGCDVVGVSTRASGETAELVTATGRRYLDHPCDLTTQDGLSGIVAAAVGRFGQIDILVNNAGIIRREDAIDYSMEDWDDVINVNLTSVYFLSQKVAAQFIRQGTGGKIINTASLLSFQGGIRVPAYTASKFGINGLTMAMANEWTRHGINVNAIAPGYMATDNTQALRDDPVRSKELLGRIPAGRWGTPEDMAGAVVFLASSASDYVSGFTIAVDGGWLAR